MVCERKIVSLIIANTELLYIYFINKYILIELENDLSKKEIKNKRLELLKNMRNNGVLIDKSTSDKDLNKMNKILITKNVPEYKKKFKVKCTTENLEQFNILVLKLFNDNIKKIKSCNKGRQTQKRKSKSSRKSKLMKKTSGKTKKVSGKRKSKKLKTKLKLQGGTHGAYLDRLSSKGEQPITGNDIARTMQEISELLGMLRYVPEGKGAAPFAVMFDLLQGQEKSMEYYLKFNVFPKYGKLFPPTINFSELNNVLSNISEYLSLYTTYKNTIKQSRAERGEIVDMTPSALDKMAGKLSAARDKYLQLSRVTDINSKLLV